MTMISRAAWGARPPISTTGGMTPKGWCIHHSAAASDEAGDIAARVQAIQKFHIDGNGWNDIAYSFLVDDKGTLYEGRGFGVVPASQGCLGNEANPANNRNWYSICYLGIDPDHAGGVDDAVKLAIYDFIAESYASHGVPRAVTYHGALCSTDCPGADLTAWVKAGAPRPGTVHIQSQPAPEEEDMYLRATDPKTGEHAMCDRDGNVITFNPDGTIGGTFLGTLVTLRKHFPNFTPLGPVVAFWYYDDHSTRPNSAYVMVIEEPGKTTPDRFHPANFPANGSLK